MKLMLSSIIAVSLLGVAGCKKNAKETKWQYMPDMADAPTVKAQEDFLDPPPHAVAVNAILYPKTAEESEKLLNNPLAVEGADPKGVHLAHGKKMYETYCAVCHGKDGKGQGTVTDKFPPPPDLMNDINKKRADGFFFHKITFGSAIMPSYGHATSPMERWEIVMHLRKLQGGAN